MQHLCARCRNAVTSDHDGSLIFCTHCGAPQVWLGEELALRAEADRAGMAEAEASGEKPLTGAAASDPTAVDWRGAIQCAGIAGVVAIVLGLLSLLPFSLGALLSLFWAMGAPVVMLGIYSSRFPRTRILPGFGAKLGVLCGLAVGLGSMIVNIASLLMERLVLHHTIEADAAMNAQFTQLGGRLAEQGAPADWIGWLNYPETRAGMFLAGMVLVGAVYLLFSALGGAFAGMLRARKP